jgi:hypothetical protein
MRIHFFKIKFFVLLFNNQYIKFLCLGNMVARSVQIILYTLTLHLFGPTI